VIFRYRGCSEKWEAGGLSDHARKGTRLWGVGKRCRRLGGWGRKCGGGEWERRRMGELMSG